MLLLLVVLIIWLLNCVLPHAAALSASGDGGDEEEYHYVDLNYDPNPTTDDGSDEEDHYVDLNYDPNPTTDGGEAAESSESHAEAAQTAANAAAVVQLNMNVAFDTLHRRHRRQDTEEAYEWLLMQGYLQPDRLETIIEQIDPSAWSWRNRVMELEPWAWDALPIAQHDFSVDMHKQLGDRLGRFMKAARAIMIAHLVHWRTVQRLMLNRGDKGKGKKRMRER